MRWAFSALGDNFAASQTASQLRLYATHFCDIWRNHLCFRGIFGAGEWTRTTDLLITNQLLCQLSYTGIGWLDGSRV